ncbi:hypothetical protein CHS0354_012191 [Potamilus streckersoni]|uniref:Uncharacterized protein n=1 Tax=Potamilus streckersoni TaxID=2493646 RepID=A0AAE0VS40_9BIVA|nr:hypothetical protein CHS0354_012191 [Potamilus streckersoni]
MAEEISLELTNNKSSEVQVFLPNVQEDNNGVENFYKSASNVVTNSGTAEKTIRWRLKTDQTFRRKFILTVWTFAAFIGFGLISGQGGPSFPDLQLIVNEDLATASWLNIACSVGFIAGSLIWGVICDRFDRVLILFFATFGTAITNGAVPWCSTFTLMIFMKVLSCFFPCGIEIAGSTLILTMWESEGAFYNQAIHFAFALGGIISPQIIAPFLAQPTFDSLKDTLNVSNSNKTDNISYFLSRNVSFNDDCCNGTTSDSISSFNGQVTYVHHGYLITSSLSLLCSVPLLVSFFRPNDKIDKLKKDTISPVDALAENLPLKLKIPTIIFLCLILNSYVGVEATYASYLMTFCIRHMKWTKADGSIASSLYWLGFCVGRFLGIFLARFLQSCTLLFTFCILIILSFLGLLLGSLFYMQTLVWVFIAVVGFAFSPVFPSVFSWTEERFFPVSGRIASLLMLSSSLGAATVPIYLVRHISSEVHADRDKYFTEKQEMECLNKVNEFKDY